MELYRDRNRFTKSESMSVLIVLEAFASSGYGLLDSLVLKSKSEKKQGHKDILNSCISAIKRSEPIPQALQRHGIIDLEEQDLLAIKNPEGASVSLRKIIEMREKFAKKFEKTFLYSLIPTIGSTYLVLIGLMIYSPELVGYFENTMKQLKLSDDSVNQIESLLFYLYNENMLYYLFIFSTTLIVGFTALYVFLYQNKRHLIYKFFPLKAVDDAPKLLMIMAMMQASGSNTASAIMKKMSKYESYKGLESMFLELDIAVQRKTGMHIVMEKYNLPKEVVILIEAGEMSGRFWEKLPSVAGMSERLSSGIFTRWEKRISPIKSFLPLLPIILALVSLLGANMMTSMLGVVSSLRFLRG